MEQNKYDVIIIGGSYAGLAAGMTLGRSLRKVLIIDSGQPCNRFTHHAQNFITHDGDAPHEIALAAKKQVKQYESVKLHDGLAIKGIPNKNGFMVETQSGEQFQASKLILATGLKDILPNISGLAECWGKSVVHCPYCHGYEIRNVKTGILANGDVANHYAPLVANLTKELTIFTNGKSLLTEEQESKIRKNNIELVEKEVSSIEQENGAIKNIVFKDGSKSSVQALYYGPAFEQHSSIPAQLGCVIHENGLLAVDELQRTSVKGVYACGDNSSKRFLAIAVSSGNIAGAGVNYDMVMESF